MKRNVIKENFSKLIFVMFLIAVCVFLQFSRTSIIGLVLLLPNKDKLSPRKKEYILGIKRSEENPLYIKNFLRKEKSNSILADLKGLLYCQIVIIIVLFAEIINKWFYKNNIVEEILLCIAVAVLVLWVLLSFFYIRNYNQGFQYLEDKKGSWLPFSAMFKPCKNGYGRVLQFEPCPYTTIREKLIFELVKDEYQCVVNLEDITFLKKEMEKEIVVFSIAYMHKLNDYYIRRCNEKFVELFNITDVKKNSSTIYMLLFVDEIGDIEEFLNNYEVTQKKDRYRLPSILIGTNVGLFDQLIVVGCLKERKKYSRMRRELIDKLNSAVKIWE